MDDSIEKLPLEVKFAGFYNKKLLPEIESFLAVNHSNSQSKYVGPIVDSLQRPYIVIRCASDFEKHLGIRIHYNINSDSFSVNAGLCHNYELEDSELRLCGTKTELFQGALNNFNPENFGVIMGNACKQFEITLF